METRPLTPQQQKVLTFVEEFSERRGFPPTLREIGDAIGLANVNAVRGHLAALEKKGYITKTPEKARSIRVVHSPSAFSEFKRKLHEVFRTDDGVVHGMVYGLAWTTRRRAPVLIGPRRKRIDEAFEREAVEHGWTILAKRIEPDHVVLVVEVWPNHSAELTVRRFQAAGRAARRRYPKEFSTQELWEKGYVATTDLDLLDELVQRALREKAGEDETSK